MTRILPVLVLIILFVSTLAGYIATISEGYPASPFKWAQERRRRVERARLNRIKELEHDLGYRPCSDDDCRSCKTWDRQLQERKIPHLTDHVRLAYDKQVEQAKRLAHENDSLRKRTASGGPL